MGKTPDGLTRNMRIPVTIGFTIANLLWIKAIIDISNFQVVQPDFRFPGFFIPLFGVGALCMLVLSILYVKEGWSSEKECRPGKWHELLLWLAIPVSVLCTIPVCYQGNIFVAPYPMSTVLRWILLLAPLGAGLLYFNGKRRFALRVLLALSFILLIPNDRCYNAFNYWWIDQLDASPLTYLPTMLVILCAIAGLRRKKEILTILIVYGICTAALFIAIGHRVGFLW